MEVDESPEDETSYILEGKKSKISKLRKRLGQNPYDYSTHLTLVSTLKEVEATLTELRSAREQFAQTYPLTERIWLDWIADERKHHDQLDPSEEKSAQREFLFELFNRAVADYVSCPNVWLEFCQFSLVRLPDADGASFIRSINERALTACGLHVTDGHLLWDCYRIFENALAAIRSGGDGGANVDAKRSLVERISRLYQRQVVVPLLNCQSTWQEYVEWAGKEGIEIADAAKTGHLAALGQLEKRIDFEKQLSEIDPEDPKRRAVWKDYIALERATNEPQRIQMIYERCVAENATVDQLWLEYTNYLDTSLKIAQQAVLVYRRAVRNCPWSGELWARFIKAVERSGRLNEVDAVFDEALQVGLPDGDSLRQVYVGYLDFMRRSLPREAGDERNAAIDRLRDKFKECDDLLRDVFGKTGDPDCQVMQYWARLEAYSWRNLEKSRALWNSIMSRAHGNNGDYWLTYLQMERSVGDEAHCRKLLTRAVSSVVEQAEPLFSAYIQFERECGTLDELDLAAERIERRRVQLAERQQQLNEKQRIGTEKTREDRRKRGKTTSGDSSQHSHQDGTPSKRSRQSSDSNESSSDSPATSATRGHDSAFKVPAAPASASRKPADTAAEPEQDAKTRQLRVVIVKNLAYTLHEDELRAAFQSCGPISDVRMVRQSNGKFRGFAYVEFAEADAAQKAITLDRQPLNGRPMFISAHEENAKNRPTAFKYKADGPEPHKLYVSNLPRQVDRTAVERIFSAYGQVTDVRLVTRRDGSFKGIAFVEFSSAEEASKALLATDGQKVGDNEISVAISNPPARREPAAGSAGSSVATTSLLPRSVRSGVTSARHKTVTVVGTGRGDASTNGNGIEEPAVTGQTMTNDDFKKMLLKH